MKTILRLTLSVICIAALSACGRSDSKPASQVAVKVNGEEISVHQMNAVLGRMGTVDAAQAEIVRAQALERLVDQEVLVQKAIEAKLDRDANVVSALDASRRQILVQAYLERVASVETAVTPEEVREYYLKHPELFAKRRVYRFQEIAAAVNDKQRKEITEQVKKSRNMNQLANWMREQKIPFNGDTALKAAEQLPLGLLPKFHAMQPGEVQIFPGADRILVVQLIASQEVPMNEKEAEPFITRYIAGQKRSEAAAKELKQLRTVAKVEYVGEFAKTAQTKPAPKTAAPDAVKSDADAMNKALSGLK